jgi:Cys-tRNA(Pro)/Cys-tRNA(Cys) deacylase
MPKPHKTHAVRLLEAKRVPHRVIVYDPDTGFHSAEDAASLIGAPVEAVYKTLVILREDEASARPLMVMIRGDAELDLKLLASALDAKKVRMARHREAEALTGMEVGGISALALQKLSSFDIFIDEAARSLEQIYVSAGARGMEIELSVADLARVTNARFVRVTT